MSQPFPSPFPNSPSLLSSQLSFELPPSFFPISSFTFPQHPDVNTLE